ncbi:MAG: nucleotidyltransferase family protein [Betaproteobacteria bacterium]|nr:nucleotidyltransferase family protein [Betaproteobacteria bacterium]
MATAMILAAGRGERMRPLSDAIPKPLLPLSGKPLIVWQIEALARADFTEIVINVAWLGGRIREALGDGAALGVRIAWSVEAEALETAGGIATALPLLPAGPVAVVSGDVWTRYDYAKLHATMARMAAGGTDRAHLVMVPNPPYHPEGDFALAGGRIAGEEAPRLTFGNIAIYDTALFGELPRGVKLKLLPLFRQWIGNGIVSGERFDGAWANVGTPQELADLDRRLREGRAGDGAADD